MNECDLLAERFEEHRSHLQAVAYRMVGSASEADDAVQEAWIRLSRTDTSDVDNLGGWLTTVVARVCLDMLRSRSARREEPWETHVAEPASSTERLVDPEYEAVLADSVGPALLVVLETLAPAERLAFVLHDMFGVPFDEIAPIVGRSTDAARQLASRARRRVQGARTSSADPDRQRDIVDAFLAAARRGDFDALVALLDPDAVLRADAAAVATGAPGEILGAAGVAGTFSGRARAAQVALLDGIAGLVWASRGRPQMAFDFTVEDGKIVEIEMVADPDRLGDLEIVIVSE